MSDIRCPVCRKPAVKECKPFCSKRCQDADLGNWVMEKYRVPERSTDTPEESVALTDDEDTLH